MNLHTDYPQVATTSTGVKEPQYCGASRSILSILAYQYTNASGVSADDIQRNLRKEESLPPRQPNDHSTWTHAQQRTLVSHELARRRQSLQFDEHAFRRVKAELRRAGTVTGLGAVQLLDQQVIANLSERRIQQARNAQKRSRTPSAA